MFFAEKEICPGQACGWWAVVGANNCAVTDTSAMHNRVSQFFWNFVTFSVPELRIHV